MGLTGSVVIVELSSAGYLDAVYINGYSTGFLGGNTCSSYTVGFLGRNHNLSSAFVS